MRPNPYGIRYFRAKWQSHRLVYYWLPPTSSSGTELFKYRMLGSDFLRAAAAAKELNRRLDAQLARVTSPPRQQRWMRKQLDAFIQMSDQLGYPSIDRCALLCMELVQRHGDILSLKWDDYRESLGAWHIRQSKRGTQVWVPETD